MCVFFWARVRDGGKKRGLFLCREDFFGAAEKNRGRGGSTRKKKVGRGSSSQQAPPGGTKETEIELRILCSAGGVFLLHGEESGTRFLIFDCFLWAKFERRGKNCV